MFIVTQIPFVLTLWYSFQRYNLNYPTAPRDFPTLYNYDAVFADPIFRTAVVNTVLLTAVPVIVSVMFGVGIALLLSTWHSGARLASWTTFRLFLMPFCVSSFSALV